MSDSLSELRHSARGCLNAVKLCVSALELECTREEQLEFLDDIIRSSDNLSLLIDDLNALFDAQGSPQTSHHI